MTDRFTVRAVVLLLGVFAIAGLGGLVWLIDHQVAPEPLAIVAGLTGTALGSLGTLLATTGSHSQPVYVTNPEESPVPVSNESGHSTIDTACLVVLAVVAVLALFVGLPID